MFEGVPPEAALAAGTTVSQRAEAVREPALSSTIKQRIGTRISTLASGIVASVPLAADFVTQYLRP